MLGNLRAQAREGLFVKIAFFTDTFLPNVDGVVRSIQTLRAALEARGHDVLILTSGSASAAKQNTDSRVHYFRGLPLPFYKQYKIALAPFRAKRIVEENGCEIVHCHALASMGFAARSTARELGLPLVGTFHTLVPYATHRFIRPSFAARLTERVLWKAICSFYAPFDLVTAPSHAVARELAACGVRAPLRVVPNAVDCKRFNPRLDSSRARHRYCRDGEALVLSTGRLSPEKNVDVLVRAAPLVLREHAAHFVVTGEGPARRSCERLARRLGVDSAFSFTGFVGERDLLELYGACDVFVTASTFETQCLSLLEAMACGKPCVAARAAALPEAVRDGENGFLFKPGSVRDCARAISRVLGASPAARQRFGLAARRTALRVAVPRVVREWEGIYGGLLKK